MTFGLNFSPYENVVRSYYSAMNKRRISFSRTTSDLKASVSANVVALIYVSMPRLLCEILIICMRVEPGCPGCFPITRGVVMVLLEVPGWYV